jgi:hypothetical protein
VFENHFAFFALAARDQIRSPLTTHFRQRVNVNPSQICRRRRIGKGEKNPVSGETHQI